MNDATEIKIRLNKWFSGLSVEQCQKTASALSCLLADFDGLKRKLGSNCKLAPCNRRAYSRGLCARHYAQLRKVQVASQAPWATLARIGICNVAVRYGEGKDERVGTGEPPRSDDPLRVLVR